MEDLLWIVAEVYYVDVYICLMHTLRLRGFICLMCFSGLVREYTRATKLHLIRLVKRHHHRERAFPAIVVRSDSWPLRIRITRFVSTGYEASSNLYDSRDERWGNCMTHKSYVRLTKLSLRTDSCMNSEAKARQGLSTRPSSFVADQTAAKSCPLVHLWLKRCTYWSEPS